MPAMPKNRWTREMERRASTLSAASMFVLYLAGGMLLIIATFTGLAGLLMVTGALGAGWGARLGGAGLLLLAAAGFFIGWWTTVQFTAQRRP